MLGHNRLMLERARFNVSGLLADLMSQVRSVMCSALGVGIPSEI